MLQQIKNICQSRGVEVGGKSFHSISDKAKEINVDIKLDMRGEGRSKIQGSVPSFWSYFKVFSAKTPALKLPLDPKTS